MQRTYVDYVKRGGDVVIAGLVFVLLVPLFFPIMLILRCTGEGEIFYKQSRIGRAELPFSVLKFATMKKGSEKAGAGSLTVKNDARVLPFGRVLRYTKLNELPQLVNVIRGDMSLVGPRPQPLEDYMIYSPEHRLKISTMRPGVTGIGSIMFRDEQLLYSQSQLSPRQYYESVIAPSKSELESWYSENISFRTDFMITLLTLFVVICPVTNSSFLNKFFDNLPASNES